MDDVYMGDSEPEHIAVEEDQLDENQKLFLNNMYGNKNMSIVTFGCVRK